MSSPSKALPALAPRRTAAAWRRLRDGIRFRDVFILTAFPVLAMVLLVGAAVRDYARAIQFDDYWSASASVVRSFSGRVNALLALPARLLVRQRLDPDAKKPGVIRLTVPGRAWDSIQSDGQAGWGHWVEGELRYGSTMIPVRVRKRGDNSVHWLTDKRTLTVRTPRDEFYKRFRSFGLSAKDVLPAYVANRLAGEFGLLAPETEVVPVYLNNRYYGIFRFLEVADESFLRPFDRMPGNIFRGDRAERGDYWKGVPRLLFENPTLWDRVALNDRWTSAGPGQLELLVRDLNGRTFEDHLRAMHRLDPDEYARLFAYLLLAGDPYHMDRVHNEFLYEDPSTQRLHPIPWDIRLLDLARPERELNDLFEAMLANPYVVDRTVHEIVTRIRRGRAVAVGDSLADAAERRYPDEFRYDRLRQGLIPDVGSREEVSRILHRNADLLARWTDSSVFAVHVGPAGNALVIDLESRGFVGADLVALTIGDGPPGRPALRLDTNLNGRLDAGDRAVDLIRDSTGRYRPAGPLPLYSAWNTRQPGVGPGRLAYRLFLTGVRPSAGISLVLVNRATGEPASRIDWAPGSAIAAPTAWHPWRYPTRASAVHRWSGTMLLTETLRIPEGDTLIVAPGTTIRLGPDVSIVSRGRVVARGTAARPIRILPADSVRPWGALVMHGHGADSSVITDAEIAGGGGALVDRVEYTGMVNVHHVVGVRFERVTMRDNVRSDDTFHALHAEITLRDSRLLRANSDAIDLDISSGLIENNDIEGSHNDGLDLMTSTPRIIGNRITGSGDKGISVGEASRPFVFANTISGCDIGIEIKDRSEPVILDNEIRGSRIGLRERRKNWRYGGGGWPTVVNTAFLDNATTRVRDSLSRFTAMDVVGLDSLPALREPGLLDWLSRRHGVAATEGPPGVPASWRLTEPEAPLVEARFRDDFGPVSDGWVPSGGTTRLEKRRDALVLEMERVLGRASLAVDWDLRASGGRLVLQVAGRDLAGAAVVLQSDRGPVRRAIEPTGDLALFRFVVVDLPPGRYRELALEAMPHPGLSHLQRNTGLSVLDAGRLDLREYVLSPVARPGSAVAP